MALLIAYETQIFVHQYNRAYDVRGFAERLAHRVPPADEIVAFRYGRLAYDFYLERSIPQIRDLQELRPVLAAARPVYVLTDERGWAALATESAGTWSVLDRAEIGGRAVLLLIHEPRRPGGGTGGA